MRFKTSLIALAFVLTVTACEKAKDGAKSEGPAMPTPTVTSAPDTSAEMPLSALTLINAKLRTPTADRPTAGYLMIENGGTEAETLTGITSADFGRIEMHDTLMADGMMSMKKQESFEIPAQSTLAFEPGGKHLMLFDAKKPLKNGDSVKVTLTFAKAGPMEANFVVLNEIPVGAGHEGMKH